jgi:hypothetical protein
MLAAWQEVVVPLLVDYCFKLLLQIVASNYHTRRAHGSALGEPTAVPSESPRRALGETPEGGGGRGRSPLQQRNHMPPTF